MEIVLSIFNYTNSEYLFKLGKSNIIHILCSILCSFEKRKSSPFSKMRQPWYKGKVSVTGNQEDYSEVRQELEKHENLNFMMSYIMTLQFLMHVKGTNIHHENSIGWSSSWFLFTSPFFLFFGVHLLESFLWKRNINTLFFEQFQMSTKRVKDLKCNDLFLSNILHKVMIWFSFFDFS